MSSYEYLLAETSIVSKGQDLLVPSHSLSIINKSETKFGAAYSA